MSEARPGNKLYDFLDQRLKLESLRQFASEKVVPSHSHSAVYYTGGITLFLFIIQVCSGILLLMYYKGSAETAFESVRYIMSEVQFGWLMRDIHSWSANLMILFAFLHMFSVYFTKAYRFPRELTWISGMVLLVLALGFGFSGYLLPWNELAFFATKVGTDMVGAVPLIGEPLLKLLRGSEDVTGATLSRFFGIHVAILPGLFMIFLSFHLILIQRLGISEPESWKDLPPEKKKYTPFFPNFVLRDFSVWLIILAGVAALSVLFPWELGTKADPFAPAPQGIKPEWYFLFMYQTLKFIPAHVIGIEGEVFGIMAFAIGAVLWTFVPFLDNERRRQRVSKFFNFAGILIVIYIFVLTALGHYLE
ncbi:MAG: cytochrome bc complex cytochrome b subunit [candidate division Zixibacteria bacterium]|nr:cytochrome bc complex cytochrome b subunit [candidate division Zixibacteria bacterium]NIR67587.1 cytochrome bc complex cytochrome b subunit [candidate division Zixibacteria bacterium]NIS16318.1 cytochrome bc complex cytochrome b subunit [candidate division Zixibacteria bacterium]NIS48848.1 cytochrome bc complex cytochrome b subunit [candidate division Zixibacteria bacterium]NIT52696.1 cytochrome bc complex cytochrome b subunit [candidate division Zixibacteria bacterium]